MKRISIKVLMLLVVLLAIPYLSIATEVGVPESVVEQVNPAKMIVEECFQHGDFTVEIHTPDGVQLVKFICLPILGVHEEDYVEEVREYEL